MPTVADYIVLRDNHFDLDHEQEREIAFDLPDQLSNVKLVLAYQARPIASPPFQAVSKIDISLKFQQHIDTVTIRGDTIHGLWETFPRLAVNTDITNTLIFKSLSGTVRISDVVLWFQRNV
jgi:hypothetical protein